MLRGTSNNKPSIWLRKEPPPTPRGPEDTGKGRVWPEKNTAENQDPRERNEQGTPGHVCHSAIHPSSNPLPPQGHRDHQSKEESNSAIEPTPSY